MGITYMHGDVTGSSGNHAGLDFLVDSGAHFTVLPHEVWNALGLSPQRRQRFVSVLPMEPSSNEIFRNVTSRFPKAPATLQSFLENPGMWLCLE
jgi:hypothetical protein